jgi:hypothetical protein
MNFAERFKIVPMGADLDMTATVVTESVNCKDMHHATIIFIFDAGLGTASSVLTVHSGATAGVMTSDLTFRYAFGSAATLSANSDVLAATATSAALTITHGTYSSYMLIVDVDMSEMTAGHDWLTCELTDPGTATGNVSVVGIFESRYPGNQSGTVTA